MNKEKLQAYRNSLQKGLEEKGNDNLILTPKSLVFLMDILLEEQQPK